MATSAGTTADNVRNETNTQLTDVEIEGDASNEGVLDLVEREIDRAYPSSPGFSNTQHRVDFEAALAALRIAEGLDRRGLSVGSGRTSTEYETQEVANLRKRVRRRDPGSEFGHSGHVVVDDGRHTTTTS